MPCDRTIKTNQTIQERATEIREVVARLTRGLAAGTVKAKVGPQGAIAFLGLTDSERDGVTDNCAYRRLMASGSALAIAAIAKAEQLAGRSIDRQQIAIGAHTHDGTTWHSHKG